MSPTTATSRYVQVDLTKTITKANYARLIKKSQTHVQDLIKDGHLKTVKIDSVTFVIKP